MHNLASIYLAQGEMEGAKGLQMRALEGARQVLGNEHPNTLTVMENLADILRQLGDAISAETLRKEAEEIRQRQEASPAPPRGQ